MADNSPLEVIVQELKDVNDIKKLKARYCHLVDGGEWDTLEKLWIDEAVCDYGFFGRFVGKTEIMDRFFRDLVSNASSFNAHMIHNPIIDIDGDIASGKWYLTAHTTIQPKNQAVWVQGIYNDRFVRIDSEWKIAELAVEFRYYTAFEEGWAKTPFWDPKTA
jgi:hypothetical protein